jgi:hypothetical protein
MSSHQSLKTERDWQNYFLSELLVCGYHYHIEDWLTAGNALRFLHLSPNFDEIIRTGQIQVSGGGLMGVVYVTPIRNTGEVHNLGKYIFNTELPQTEIQTPTDCLVFETSKDQYCRSIDAGSFNYIFESYRYAEGTDLSIRDEMVISDALQKMTDLLADLGQPMETVVSKRLDDFFNEFSFLKHIYFETLNEYLYIRQNSPESRDLAAKGEVMAKFVKDYLFTTAPALKKSFSTTHFVTDTLVHIKNLETNQSIIAGFSRDDFLAFLGARISYYFQQIIERPAVLIGRYLLKSRNSEERYVIETRAIKALWQERREAALFQYNTIPKGEVGLVPHTGTKAFRATYDNGFVKDIEPVNVQITPRLIASSGSVLRVK